MIYLGETQAKTLEFLKTGQQATYTELRKRFGTETNVLRSLVRKRLIIKQEQFPCAVYKINPQRKDCKYIVMKPHQFVTLTANIIERDYENKMEKDEEFKKQVGLDTHNSS